MQKAVGTDSLSDVGTEGPLSKTDQVIQAIMAGHKKRHMVVAVTGHSYKTVNGLVHALIKQERVKVTNIKTAKCTADQELKVVRKEPWPRPPAGLTAEVRMVISSINAGHRTRSALEQATCLCSAEIDAILLALERSNWVKITNPIQACRDPRRARFLVNKAPANPAPIELPSTRDSFNDLFPSWCRTTPPPSISIPSSCRA